jgi:hypothetical protein
MRDSPVPTDLPTIGDRLSAWLGIGPTHAEVEAVAHDLILRHGVWAHDEAIHLSEIARFIGSARNAKLYRLAADRIRLSFEVAWESIRQRRTKGAAPSLIAAEWSSSTHASMFGVTVSRF